MRTKLNLLIIFFFILFFNSQAQIEPIDVADLTLKIRGLNTEEIFFGFAEGDQIIFNFELLKGKSLKEIEIIELPSNSKFMDYKTNKITDKKIKVNNKSVYKFSLKNSSVSGRICKVKIQRVPQDKDFISFNTNWKWKTLYDTTYVPYTQDSLVGYDTTYLKKTRKVLIKTDTLVTELFNKTARVHSETAIGKTQYSYLDVYLPTNKYIPDIYNPYQSTEIIAWSYWLGVGQKSIEEYEKANDIIASGLKTIGVLTGYGALASLAVTGISMFAPQTVGDNVNYKFYANFNGIDKTFDYGNVISASGRNTDILQGSFRIRLYNDNLKDGIDVAIKMICVQIQKTWKDEAYTKQVVKPRYVTLNKKKMVIKTTKIRINED